MVLYLIASTPCSVNDYIISDDDLVQQNTRASNIPGRARKGEDSEPLLGGDSEECMSNCDSQLFNGASTGVVQQEIDATSHNKSMIVVGGTSRLVSQQAQQTAQKHRLSELSETEDGVAALHTPCKVLAASSSPTPNHGSQHVNGRQSSPERYSSSPKSPKSGNVKEVAAACSYPACSISNDGQSLAVCSANSLHLLLELPPLPPEDQDIADRSSLASGFLQQAASGASAQAPGVSLAPLQDELEEDGPRVNLSLNAGESHQDLYSASGSDECS